MNKCIKKQADNQTQKGTNIEQKDEQQSAEQTMDNQTNK